MKILMRVITGGLALFCIWGLYVFFSPARQTEMVTYGTLEDALSVSAYIIRDETLVKAKTAGKPSFSCGEGERVARGRKIAVIHSGEIEPQAQERLARLDERIANIEVAAASSIFAFDEQRVNLELQSSVNELVIMAQSKNPRGLSAVKTNINRLLDKREIIKGNGPGAILSALKQERETLSAQLGTEREALIAPISGVFSSSIDGYETLLTVAGADSLTIEDIKSLESITPPENSGAPGSAVCKIIDNFNWRLAAAVNKSDIVGLKAGGNILIRLPDISNEAFSAKISAISDEGGDEAVIVINCDKYLESMVNKRLVSLDIVKKRRTGLRVPQEAVRVKEGETGVYAEKGSEVVFRPVEVLCTASGYAIVKENNTGKNALLLYDKVVVRDRNLK